MKQIQQSDNPARWPRMAVTSVETRKRDLVFRITDWLDDKDEPAYDVECYIGGVYDWDQSQVFSVDATKDSTSWRGRTAQEAKAKAIRFVQSKMEELL